MITIEYKAEVFKIEKKVTDILQSMRQISPKSNESGGMLMGSILSNNKSIVIRDYTVPLKGDCQTRCKFYRKKKRHNALLKNKWEKSNKIIMYLGEWHTHPEDEPEYSKRDLKNWGKIMQKAKTDSPYLFFIIAGITFYKVWAGDRLSNEISLVYKGEYDD